MDFKFNPGKLKTPITIQRATKGKDEDNRPINVLSNILSCKAIVTTYKGKTTEEANGKVYIEEKKVIIRKPRKEILDTDIVTIGGKNYDITSMIDIEEAGRFLEFKVRYSK